MASDGEKSKKSLPSDNAKASAIREDGAFWSIFAYLISGLVFGALWAHSAITSSTPATSLLLASLLASPQDLA